MKERKLRHDKAKPDLMTTLTALKQGEDDKISSTVYYGLSNLTLSEMEQFETVWESLSPAYREKVMGRLADIAEGNVEMNYRTIGLYGLQDSNAGVREKAIDVLFEDMSVELMDKLIEVAQWDESDAVRAAAASALGRFILAGELGEMPESETARAQDTAVHLLTNDEALDVRRRALESIANSSHEIVDEAIEDAYNSYEPRLKASSLFAMGRTCDERWNPVVLRELDSPDPSIRYEAARAAGELEVREAVPVLIRLAQGSDREVKEMAVWALGEIGGRDSTRALNALARKAHDADDTELLDMIEDALVSASLVDSLLRDSDDWDD